ncbi:hypothetical protein ACFVU2_20600 [Leifsonia sp. NPDC058194]|uniref:hypothetical protein n=1 Tax=Leifsonia sp. NPDC058194 TaxID=3346374 RepID=UPI0036D7FD3E
MLINALILGARGAVGRVIADDLRRQGHRVTPAGRRMTPGGLQLDLAAPGGADALAAAAADHDVVVNASGVEDPALATLVGATPLVDISATGSYLDALADTARDTPSTTGRPAATIVLGAGLVPGLSTLLIADLEPRAGDQIDLAVVLGSGEQHGPAAVEWTAGLAGRDLHSPPETTVVRNLRERRRLAGPHGERAYLRADFPDHVLVGRPGDFAVRSYLALTSPLATAALGLVGRFPPLRGLISRAPHLGGDGWSLAAIDRRTGETRSARGAGQSRATGLLAARAALAAAASPSRGPVPMSALLTLDDVADIARAATSRA